MEMFLTNLSELCVDTAKAGENKVSIDYGDIDVYCHDEYDDSFG